MSLPRTSRALAEKIAYGEDLCQIQRVETLSLCTLASNDEEARVAKPKELSSRASHESKEHSHKHKDRFPSRSTSKRRDASLILSKSGESLCTGPQDLGLLRPSGHEVRE